MGCPGIALGKDDKLKSLEAEVIVTGSAFCLDHLDDFAVLIILRIRSMQGS